MASIDKHRLAGLQDGLYSIALTLLVLDLKLPPLAPPQDNAALLQALLALWPKLLTWLVSFGVLAVYWVSDARHLEALHRVSRPMLVLSLVRLALVSLLPFSTAVMGEHGHQAAGLALYAGHLLVLAVLHLLRQRVDNAG